MPRKKPADPMDTPPGCATCRFWREDTDSQDEIRWGSCRRFPPAGVVALNPITEEHQPESVWPPTDPEDWCGEYVAKQ